MRICSKVIIENTGMIYAVNSYFAVYVYYIIIVHNNA